ncbi:16S rRNA (cytosine(1402)-N(4))-methyltransferase, partial [Candidatus Pelagibacter sp.]|nr:16S rRNA (cytosine(1402)-N(4))-methyltransferase [Candidatus Pelagibacter sp.]
MEAIIVPDTVKHYPVLLNEIISVITPQRGGTFIDCTFGQGGYTQEILKYKNSKVIGLDRDIDSETIGKKIQNKFPKRFLFENLRFGNLNNLKLKNEDIKGIIFDLGYSFTQIKDPHKGLSFKSTG